MNAVAVARSDAQIVDFVQLRLARALRQRARYLYVKPRVLREGASLRIESPCCSRNVDPQGGVIDIALLSPVASGGELPLWMLFRRDHAQQRWAQHGEPATLDELTELLCGDPDRVFWP